MRRSTSRVAAVLLASTFTPFAFAAHTHLPTPSTWTLNLAESDFGGGISLKSDTFVITEDTDKWGKWTDTAVDGNGKTVKSSWSGAEDGKPHPFGGWAGATYSSDPATDVSVEKFPDGTVQTCTFSLNASKTKFTSKCAAKSPNGKVAHQTIVYDRTK